MSLREELERFGSKKEFRGKGPLSVALVVTQHARKKGLPLEPDALVTKGGGQVLGLGKGAVQTVLKRHGIFHVLAAEGGRTSRGSLNRMREYVSFLNVLNARGEADLDLVEAYWIEKVQSFFAAKPFRIKLDPSRSLRSVVRDLIAQAEDRQRSSPGVYYAGAVLQHLVGAKLDCVMESGVLNHHSYSTSDEQTGRDGDFLWGDVAIHVTTSPGEALIERCKDNLDNNLKPVLVTTQRGVTVAEVLAENVGIAERIDVFEIEQFVALNLYEQGNFVADGRQTAVSDLIGRYNAIIEEVETDPSLKIAFHR